MKDFCIEAEQIDFELLMKIGNLLGNAGVNIVGLSVTNGVGIGTVHFAVEDHDAASSVLEEAGLEIRSITDVFVLEKDRKNVTGKPGSFGEICQTLAKNGIEIEFGYPAENNMFIFGVSDSKKAYDLLG